TGWWISIVGVGLLVALVLPRLVARRERDMRELRSAHAAPMSVADDLRAWAEGGEADGDASRDRR
ncbi:MAG: hypothetical protein ACKVS9_01790, partial [Phycisphaerae bacterium]